MARTNWTTGETVNAAALNDIGAEINNLSKIQQFSLSTAYSNAEHTVINMQKGSFTPTTSRIVVDISYAGKMEGVAHMSAFFAWNQTVSTGTDLLTGEGFLTGAYIADTSYTNAGNIASPGNTGQAHKKIVIEGLTPDVEMVWQLDIGATGYMETFVGDGDFDYLHTLELSNDNKSVFLAAFTSNAVHKYNAGNRWSVDGVSKPVDKWTVNGPYGMAVSPTNSDVIYVAEYGNDQVLELDIETGSTLRTFAVSNPLYMCVSRDGTKLFVGNDVPDVNGIVPITLSSGTVGTRIAIGAGGGTSEPKAVGDYILVPCSTGDRVDRIDVATHAITSYTGVNLPVAVDAADPDNSTTFFVLSRTPSTVREITLSSMTAVAGVPALSGTVMTGEVTDIAASPTGKSVIVASSQRKLMTFVWPPKGVVYEHGTGSAGRIRTDRFGDLWIAAPLLDEAYHFHSARFDVDPADDFWGGYSDVVIESLPESNP